MKGIEYYRLFPVNSFLTILFPLGLSDLGIYSYCTSVSTYRHSRCDYNVLHELVSIVLFKKSIVILETHLRREKKRLMINYSISPFWENVFGGKPQGMSLVSIFINKVGKELNSMQIKKADAPK